MKRLMALACFALMAPTTFAQPSVSTEALMSRLASGSIEQRTAAAQDIFGSGLDDKAIYDRLATNIQTGLVGLTKASPQLEEMAWSAKALSSSGDMSYLPIIETLANSDISYLARHAKAAKKMLEETAARGKPFLAYSKVRVISDRQAEACQYVSQNTCTTSRSPEKCIESHQANAVDAGANSIVMLLSSSQSGGLSPWGASTTMMASYYLCK